MFTTTTRSAVPATATVVRARLDVNGVAVICQAHAAEFATGMPWAKTTYQRPPKRPT